MRTTLSIDDDVLDAVKGLARHEGRPAGAVMSDLLRAALTRPPKGEVRRRNGFPLLPSRGVVVTNAQVERIREEEGV